MKRMMWKLLVLTGLMGQMGLVIGCNPEPPLYLYDAEEVTMDVPLVDLDLQVYWDYEMAFGINYDWKAEWYYGWDDDDIKRWGDIGYTTPSLFELRRYYTGSEAYGGHTDVLATQVSGTHFQGRYDWGFWDILCWNQISTIDGIQSIIFDEKSSLDSVTAHTNQTMRSSRYNAPRYAYAFHAPEPLFAAYDRAIEINESLEGFEYDAERNVYVKKLDMILEPITYIYLTQVILHNNRGRVTSIDGSASLSGMARSTTLNTGRAGSDAITVDYRVRMKNDCDKDGEKVDIIGGRLLTFGICNLNANRITRSEEVPDPYSHYMDVNMQFNNGMDSTLIFDVSSQVRKRYKGGVITIELDMDTVPIPSRGGGSGFDAVVKPIEDGGTWEFEM
jgi:hypothetical protein